MVSRLLDAADQLANEGAKSSAFKRRAVSTAYYAVFHALAKLCAESLLPAADGKSEEYSRIYRALEHRSLKPAFEKEPLKDREALRKIGELVVSLYSERQLADYAPPLQKRYSQREAKNLVDQARQAVAEINSLGKNDRRILATHLLFRARQS
jgi:uncharacterized protein (UPF0332 family)